MTGRRRGPATIRAQVGYGTAELSPDLDQPGAWTLLVDDVPQSYVDLTAPGRLVFEYVRRFAMVIEASFPAGRPLSVLHLGGGALTMPRYLAATRPGSRQRVVDRDGPLVELVRQHLPLPRGADIRVRVGDARAVLDAAGPDRFDLVLCDVYQAAQMPASVASVEFAAAVARVLRPGGRYAANVADLPPLSFCRTQAATLRTAFPDVCVLADPGMLRGRRYGNVVLAAAVEAGGLDIAALARAGAREVFRSRVLYAAELDRFIAGARPVADAAATASPRPPPSLLG